MACRYQIKPERNNTRDICDTPSRARVCQQHGFRHYKRRPAGAKRSSQAYAGRQGEGKGKDEVAGAPSFQNHCMRPRGRGCSVGPPRPQGSPTGRSRQRGPGRWRTQVAREPPVPPKVESRCKHGQPSHCVRHSRQRGGSENTAIT